MRVQSGSYSRATNGEVIKSRKHLLQPRDITVKQTHPAGHLLPHREWRRVHQMRPANLYDVLKLPRFCIDGVAQPGHGRNQCLGYSRRSRNMHSSRKRVIGRLRHVHVVIWMDRFLRTHHATCDLNRAIRNHLVGIHIGLRAAAGLPDAEWKVLVEFSGNHFVGSLNDQSRLLR